MKNEFCEKVGAVEMLSQMGCQLGKVHRDGMDFFFYIYTLLPTPHLNPFPLHSSTGLCQSFSSVQL